MVRQNKVSDSSFYTRHERRGTHSSEDLIRVFDDPVSAVFGKTKNAKLPGHDAV